MQIQEIIKLINSKESDSNVHNSNNASINRVSSLNSADTNSLSFIGDPKDKYTSELENSNAGLIFVDKKLAEHSKVNEIISTKTNTCFITNLDNAYLSFIKIASMMFPEKARPTKRPQEFLVSEKAKIDPSAIIYPGAYVGDNVEIGANTLVYPNASIYPDTKIGANVIIGPGATIGFEGFGYIKDESGKQRKIPHFGGVIIGDDVEIGANSCIDRGTLDNTIIGEGSKIDNLVQVAHNCVLGKNCILCGMVGLSGSSILEDNVIFGAGAGTGGHVTIGHDTVITARSSVGKNIPAESYMKGFPVRPIQEALKIQTLTCKLPQLFDKVRKIEKNIKNKISGGN